MSSIPHAAQLRRQPADRCKTHAASGAHDEQGSRSSTRSRASRLEEPSWSLLRSLLESAGVCWKLTKPSPSEPTWTGAACRHQQIAACARPRPQSGARTRGARVPCERSRARSGARSDPRRRRARPCRRRGAGRACPQVSSSLALQSESATARQGRPRRPADFRQARSSGPTSAAKVTARPTEPRYRNRSPFEVFRSTARRAAGASESTNQARPADRHFRTRRCSPAAHERRSAAIQGAITRARLARRAATDGRRTSNCGAVNAATTWEPSAARIRPVPSGTSS